MTSPPRTTERNPLNPIVLLGPGRSGTTLLYKLLCMHPAVAFITNYHVRPLMRPFAPLALRYVPRDASLRRRAWFTTDGGANLTRRSSLWRAIPTPVEGEAVYRACGLTLGETTGPADERTQARLRQRFRQIQKQHGASALVLKRTANNRRIPAIASAFPDAKYVLIWRDGRAVANSLVRVEWWMDHQVWWAGGKTPREMNLDATGMIELAANNWLQEVAAIERGLASVDSSRVLTIRYENLIEYPRDVITRVAQFAGLETSADYLAQVQEARITAGRDRWKTSLSPSELASIERTLEPTLRRLSYLEA